MKKHSLLKLQLCLFLINIIKSNRLFILQNSSDLLRKNELGTRKKIYSWLLWNCARFVLISFFFRMVYESKTKIWFLLLRFFFQFIYMILLCRSWMLTNSLSFIIHSFQINVWWLCALTLIFSLTHKHTYIHTVRECVYLLYINFKKIDDLFCVFILFFFQK